MRVGLGVLFGHSQVEYMGQQYVSLVRDLEILDGVVFFGIQFCIHIGGKGLSQVNVVGIGAQAFGTVRADLDGALFNFLEDARVGEDHGRVSVTSWCRISERKKDLDRNMPVFFQHTESNLHLLVWEMQEPATFFEASLPPSIVKSAPRHPDRRRQFLTGRFLLKTLIPDFPIDEIVLADSGRPFLSDESNQFSISHTIHFASVVVSQTQAVGVDVEVVSERARRVRRKYLGGDEELLLKNLSLPDHSSDDHHYTLAWSIKEAAFKALHQTGVDFIRDLPIERIEPIEDSWTVKIGGKARGMQINARFVGPVCLAWAVRDAEGRG